MDNTPFDTSKQAGQIPNNQQGDTPTKSKRTYIYLFALVFLGFLAINLSAYFLGRMSASDRISLFDFAKTKVAPQINQNQLAENTIPTVEILPSETQTPKPTPRSLPQGKQEFMISQKAPAGPILKKVVIDPYDPKSNESQTFTLFSDDQNIQSVAVTFLTDSGKQVESMTKKDDLSWEGSWILKNTHDYVYRATIDAVNTNGTSSFTISFR